MPDPTADIRLVGTRQFTWRRMDTLCRGLTKDPTSLLWRELAEAMADWDLRTAMLSSIEYQARLADWRQTKDGQSGRNRPTPILPTGYRLTNDGTTGPEVTDNTPAGTKQFGGNAMTIEETTEWLGW